MYINLYGFPTVSLARRRACLTNLCCACLRSLIDNVSHFPVFSQSCKCACARACVTSVCGQTQLIDRIKPFDTARDTNLAIASVLEQQRQSISDHSSSSSLLRLLSRPQPQSLRLHTATPTAFVGGTGGSAAPSGVALLGCLAIPLASYHPADK